MHNNARKSAGANKVVERKQENKLVSCDQMTGNSSNKYMKQ